METNAGHAGEATCPRPAVDTPIYQSTTLSKTWSRGGAVLPSKGRYVLHALWNPTLNALEEKIAVLEGAETAQVAATGMAAISACVLSLVKAGTISFSSIYLFSCL
jgi:O-acetylhomoserine/O-acetylserine sulfhydrylase-like pyridoxal-dependent enzyme